MLNLHQRYIRETFSTEGHPTSYELIVPSSFNFAYDVIDVLGDQTPERRAMLWCGRDGERRVFSFGQIKEDSDRAAAFFQTLGIGRGDVVMLILKRHHQFWPAILGLHKLGAIAVPATNQLRKEDLEYRFNAARVHSVVCTLQEGEIIPAMVEAAAKSYGKLVNFIGANGRREGWLSFDAGLAGAPPFTRPQPKDLPGPHDTMLLYFTSGTTAHPKMVSHDYLYPLAHIPTAKYWHQVVPDGLHLTVSETGWAKSIWGKLYGQWLMEAGIYVYDFDRFNAADLLQHLQDDRITTFCAPPTMYRFMLQEDLSRYDLSHIRHATIAGEALNPEIYKEFFRRTGLKLAEGFGQTETTLTVFTPYWMEPRPGSMGKPSQTYDVLLLNNAGQPVADRETGEICLRTGNSRPTGMFTGYVRDDLMTHRAWHDGIYHTGDLAYRDEDGFLWFIGRKDDMIKSSGYRISPFEVESTLMEHPGVVECAVTGVKDEIRGQKIKATIRLAAGYLPTEAMKKAIQDFVKERTAPYKYPRVIEFVDELPKTISGKIRRVELRG